MKRVGDITERVVQSATCKTGRFPSSDKDTDDLQAVSGALRPFDADITNPASMALKT